MKNRKGQVGLDVAKSIMLTLLTIGLIAFVIIVVMASIDDANVLTAGSLEANQTTAVLGNISGGVSGFFSNTATWFTLIAVVILVLIAAIILVAVNRFGGGKATSV